MAVSIGWDVVHVIAYQEDKSVEHILVPIFQSIRMRCVLANRRVVIGDSDIREAYDRTSVEMLTCTITAIDMSPAL